VSSAILLALAVLILPPPGVERRVLLLRRVPPRRVPWFRLPRPGGVLVGLLTGLLCGPGGAVAGALVGAVVWRGLRSRAAERARLSATSAITSGLGALVVELRAGAHPATAAQGAAEDSEPAAAEVLRGIASAARRGGDVDATLRALAAARPALRTALGQVAQAWLLSSRYGVPLADVLDAARCDLDRRVAFARQVQARMAGPRASAAVLAVLPLLGVLLGELSGARPLHVLSSSTAGQVLLVLGALLICAGLLWSSRLTDRAVLP
jgi:tight adherence protein B